MTLLTSLYRKSCEFLQTKIHIHSINCSHKGNNWHLLRATSNYTPCCNILDKAHVATVDFKYMCFEHSVLLIMAHFTKHRFPVYATRNIQMHRKSTIQSVEFPALVNC